MSASSIATLVASCNQRRCSGSPRRRIIYGANDLHEEIHRVPEPAMIASGRSRGPAADAIYRVLDLSWVYNLVQVVVAPGQHSRLTALFRRVSNQLPAADRVLDVGCGPSSWLWRIGIRPFGLDITPQYATHFAATGDPAVAASSAEIPFADRSFDQVWSIGLLHHLSDENARRTLAEMERVSSIGGSIVVLDAVLPVAAWRRPVAHVLRKLDRGGHVRAEAHHRAILGDGWTHERGLMAYNGLEYMLAIRQRRA